MDKYNDDLKSETLSLVQCGPAYRLGELLRLNGPGVLRRLLKVLFVLLLTWFPVVILSMAAGRAFAGSVKVPFLHDPETNGRLLVALPLLEIAFAMVGVSLAVQARSFLDMELVPTRQLANFLAARASATRLRRSYLGEGILLALAYVIAIETRLVLGLGPGDSSWERVGSAYTLAGWWHMLVSLPILIFFMLRWVWVIVCWGQFLFQVSRLDLGLTPTHPDRVGGLGFLAWGVVAFAPLLTAMSASVAAGFANEMFHRGVLLKDLKYDVFGYVAVALLFVYAPLLSFFPMLTRCRFQGLLGIGKLALDYDRAFEKKWLEGSADRKEELLGTSDIQSLADIGTAYEHVARMWFFPFDVKSFAVLAIAAAAPFAVLLPIKEFILWFGELLV